MGSDSSNVAAAANGTMEIVTAAEAAATAMVVAVAVETKAARSSCNSEGVLAAATVAKLKVFFFFHLFGRVEGIILL